MVLLEQDQEGYYVASVPALPGGHTPAKKLDTLTKLAAADLADLL